MVAHPAKRDAHRHLCAPGLLEKHGIPERPREMAALPIIRIESPMPLSRLVPQRRRRRTGWWLQPVLSLTAGERRRRRPSGAGVAHAALQGDSAVWPAANWTLFLQAMEPEPRAGAPAVTLRDLAPLSCVSSISPRRLCVRRCCVSPPPFSVRWFSAALLSVAEGGGKRHRHNAGRHQKRPHG